MAHQVELTFPVAAKLAGAFEGAARYRGAYGGRGAGRSWGFARKAINRMVLGQLVGKKTRILCGRELQNSLRDSVFQLLIDQIELLKVERFFEWGESYLRGVDGKSDFLFKGLRHNYREIKSTEGIDVLWIEEAETTSEETFRVVLPTIRAEGSEIWLTWNPEYEASPIQRRFVKSPPENAKIVKLNYTDNPWFPPELEALRLEDLRRNPDVYAHIWEGECLPAVSGAIYFREVQLAETKGRITHVPYDPLLKVHVVFDLGWNDSTAIILVQRQASALYVIDYIEDSRRTLDSYSAELRDKQYNWGKVWLPHDGFSGSVAAKPPSDILTALGWDVAQKHELAILPLESGIQTARQTFRQVYFDKDRCGRLIECLKRYRRRINNQTQAEAGPVHDEFSHGADCFRYMCINAQQMRNEEKQFMPVMQPFGVLDRTIGY